MTEPQDQPGTRWAELSGGSSGADYAARFAALAATGQDLHGEAQFCAALVPPPARVLDAGCGTGRVAIRLAGLGYQVLGVDLDESMLEQARLARPDLRWLQSDLATLDLSGHPDAAEDGFDLVVAAGNVIPLLAPGTLTGTMAGLAATLAPAGLLVTGFGLDSAHLPKGCPVTSVADYDRAATAAGLVQARRFATWESAEYLDPAGGYCVTVHRRVGADRRDGADGSR